ncbi:LysR substrate-binding domain-containing protein, partial [Xanthomonas campestris pv. campestris]
PTSGKHRYHQPRTLNQAATQGGGTSEKPNVIERAASLDVMLALVAAGYGIGLASGAKLEPCKHSDIVIRPLANQSAVITTYMLTAANAAPSISVDRFTTRLKDRN